MNGTLWTEAEYVILRQCVADGLNEAEASLRLPNRSPDTCKRRAHKIGSPFPPRNVFPSRVGMNGNRGRSIEANLKESWVERKTRLAAAKPPSVPVQATIEAMRAKAARERIGTLADEEQS